MEHFKCPFAPGDLVSARAIENRAFLDGMLDRTRRHRFFSHAFISSLGASSPSCEAVSFVLTSFYKIVAPFTGLLCALGGRAPNLRSRFALMDNIYEEMGRGDLNAAHPSLYLKMLESIGVNERSAETFPELASVRLINDHLREVVGRRHFSVASAVLASAESTIPPSFPVLAGIAQRAFREIDTTFFERHGVRDEGHSEDASILFVTSAEPSQFDVVEAEVALDLDYRSALLDEWMSVISTGELLRITEGAPTSSRRGFGVGHFPTA
jgi:pyrroloquinoline quinone (PQQ) biosynthesis protein C